jgi:nuclear transport factor 2 (NTF2) superfamily protein
MFPVQHEVACTKRGLRSRKAPNLVARGFSKRKVVIPLEYRDAQGQWFRAYGNEQWEYNAYGLMQRREASINDVTIAEAKRKFRWPLGMRPANHPGLTELGM